MPYCNFQGPVGSTGITGPPGTKGEMVRNDSQHINGFGFQLIHFLGRQLLIMF